MRDVAILAGPEKFMVRGPVKSIFDIRPLFTGPVLDSLDEAEAMADHMYAEWRNSPCVTMAIHMEHHHNSIGARSVTAGTE